MAAGWGYVLRGENALRSAVIAGGVTMHAVNVFIVTTILPSVVHDIGGLEYFAWSTTLYVVTSLIGGASCARLLQRIGARGAYRLALAGFALGCLICATAPTMGVLLLGRAVQGLGAGLLSALSFSMVRLLFPQDLWSRALAIVSMAWGIATLAGPAIGGVFAEFGAWRSAFWTLLLISPLMLAMVEWALPRALARPEGGARIAWASLGVLAASALVVSAGSMAASPWLNALSLAVALGGLAAFVWRERAAQRVGGARVLPRGATDIATRLGAAYGSMLLMLVAVTSEVFTPYFLQTLHGQSPLHAGYMSALMSAGWSVGAVVTASRGRLAAVMQAGPLVMLASMLALAVLMPFGGGATRDVVLIGVALAGLGLGIGIGWPHLGASVFAAAPVDERNLASASLTTITMMGNALGSALAGMVTNVVGLAQPGAASAWLFGLLALGPLLAALLVRRVVA